MNTKIENHAEEQARMQVASIVEMVRALELDYDRLGELRDKRKAGCYAAGWNMPGYMPDIEPATFDTDTEARDYLADEMARHNDETEFKIEDAAIEDCRTGAGEYGTTLGNYHYWVTFQPNTLADDEESEELEELESAAGDCINEDQARERIQDDPLSAEVRSGWASSAADFEPEEFRIVLCTGGPHVEIVGNLDHGEPDRVRIMYRDWGTSGELLDFDHDAVLTYAQQFYFGE